MEIPYDDKTIAEVLDELTMKERARLSSHQVKSIIKALIVYIIFLFIMMEMI